MAIFVHALEGKPDDPKDFNEKSERDIRVRWLVTDSPHGQVGSGPWMVKAQPDPTKIVLVRSGNKPEPQHIEEVHLPFIPKGEDVADRLVLDYTDPRHVDFAPTLTDPNTFARLQHDSRVQVLTMPGLNIFYLGLITDQGPFMNEPIRKAMVRAIDVHTHAALGGGAADSAIGPVPPCMVGYDPNLQQDRLNLAQAEILLKSSGYDARLSLNLVYNSANTYTHNLAQVVVKTLTSIGLAVTPHAFGTWGEVVNVVKAKTISPNTPVHMFLYSWHQRSARANDPYEFLIALFHSTRRGTTNLTWYNNPRVDALLSPGPQQNHHEAQRIIIQDAPMVFLSHWKRKAAYNVRVQNLQLNPGTLPHDKLVGVDVVPT